MTAAVLCLAAMAVSDDAAAQYRINTGCPSIDQLPPNATAADLKGCFPTSGPSTLHCGQLRAIARISVGTPEGQVALNNYQHQCPSSPQGSGSTGTVSAPTPPVVPQGISVPDGVYQGWRGYTRRNHGVSRRICKDSYQFYANVIQGTITFESGGHTWRGVVADNGWIHIGREGVWPRPKNPTAIQGPANRAQLYNGYCGWGEFRLGQKLQ